MREEDEAVSVAVCNNTKKEEKKENNSIFHVSKPVCLT